MPPEDLAQMKPATRHTPRILVQRFPQEGRVWLQHRDGEGGSFDAEEVGQVLLHGKDLEQWFWQHF